MNPVRSRFQTEVHLGILALIILLLFLNFTSDFLIYTARSSERSAVMAQLTDAARAVGQVVNEHGVQGMSGERQSEIMRVYRLDDFVILPEAPDDTSPASRRRWLATVIDRFPPDRVPEIARQVLKGAEGELCRGAGAQFFLAHSIEAGSERAFLVLTRTEPKLARLEDVYRLALIMSVIALAATAAVYVILSRLIFAPFRQAKEDALTAGRAIRQGDDDVEGLLDDYRQMIGELREKERELLRLNREVSSRADSLEQFNRCLLASVRSGIVTIDRQGVIRTMNTAAGTALGLKTEEAIGQPHARLLPAELSEVARGILSDNRGGDYREIRLGGPHGFLVLGVSASAISDSEGDSIGLALLINDVTEITYLREQLERRARLASLGEMSGGLAHQLRNSLGAISGYLNLMRKRLGRRGIDEPAVSDLARETSQAEVLVRRFLEFARPLQVDLQCISLHELVREAAASFGMREDYPGITVQIERVPDLRVQGDPLLLRQVLLNLIENAANAYAGATGIVTMEGEATGGEILLRVKDAGGGIAAENLARIFTPFYSSRPSGTGLGLSLVSKIVDLHRGRITVNSRLGEGSSFTISLPTDGGAVTEAAPADLVHPGA